MAKGEEKRTERFSMRLPASVYARLRNAANADHRSMADVTLIALEAYLNSLESRTFGSATSASKPRGAPRGTASDFGGGRR